VAASAVGPTRRLFGHFGGHPHLRESARSQELLGKNAPRKNVPRKDVPGKNVPGKNVPGNNIPGENVSGETPPTSAAARRGGSPRK
jgi:hypothetical protein